MDTAAVLQNVRDVAARFAAARSERQQRRALVAADFALLAEAGFLLCGVPVDEGGIWESAERSGRSVCEMLRALAHGDSSVALVSAMHPTVLGVWLNTPTAAPPFAEAWQAQHRHVFETARQGAWWGTITSEPGTGGDVSRTAATARPAGDGRFLLTGQKQFGSGSGISSYMITIAMAEGDASPSLFFLDMRGVPWDGSAGVTLVAPWDGHGMAATQSHAMAFKDFPATRSASPAGLVSLMEANGALIAAAFTAVIVGIVETAVEAAREQVIRRRDGLRAYEKVEWARAEMEGWLAQQAYEGMLRAMEEGKEARRRSVQAKIAIAELAESATGRICRLIGGGTFSRSSPFGYWHEDVRALGFLRPPWGLAYDNLFEWSCAQAAEKGPSASLAPSAAPSGRAS
jgi:alkylation response protein AidB-like acyl-CoA dehydrogenase